MVSVRPLPQNEAVLIGRDAHLNFLNESFETVVRGRTVAIHLHGLSGSGKSTLLHHFLNRLAGRGRVVVLSGRCYERESVPYKAIDSLADALGQYLMSLPDGEVRSVLPAEVWALAKVFPALRRVEAVRAPRRSPCPATRWICGVWPSRRSARMLTWLGIRLPLVLAIDDIQWSDLDSANLLTDLLRPPDPPVLLLVACSRDEDRARELGLGGPPRLAGAGRL